MSNSTSFCVNAMQKLLVLTLAIFSQGTSYDKEKGYVFSTDDQAAGRIWIFSFSILEGRLWGYNTCVVKLLMLRSAWLLSKANNFLSILVSHLLDEK